jgi:thiol-disulfide isomerase/thioredoxin
MFLKSTKTRLLLLLTFFFFSISFGQVSKETITLIFKKSNYNVEDIKGKRNANQCLNYSEWDSFFTTLFYPNNDKTEDTLRINASANKLFFEFKWFNSDKKTKGILHKGDVVEVAYDKGFPEFTVLNRASKMYDLNLEQQLNLHIPVIKSVNIEAEGYGKYKKAKKLFQEDLKLFYEDLKPKLANLLANGQISEEVYQAQLNYTKFYSLVQVEDSNLKDYNEELKTESLIVLQPYLEFLDAFVKREMEIKQIEKKVTNANIKHGNKTINKVHLKSSDAEDKFNKIEASPLFSTQAKEYLLYDALNGIAKTSPEKLSEYLNRFKNYSTDTKLIDGFQKAFLIDYEALKKVSDQVILLDENKNQITLEKVFGQHKGKGIYVDFWASWCGPCRTALPKSRELHNEYKDIVFLYLSTDTNYEAWLKANKYEKLEQNSYFILNKKADYLKSLEINFIPRYIMYNQESVLIDKNAPRPESPEIKTALNTFNSHN